MEQFFRLFQTDTIGDRDQPVLGHHVRHLLVHVRFEAQIPVGDDADEFVPLGDGDPRNPVLLHQLQHFGHFLVRADSDRVHDHAAFRLFDLVDLQGLGLDFQVAVDETQSTLPGHADGGVGLGDGVHRRAHDGNAQADVACQTGVDGHVFGQHIGVAGHQQHIVK